jgi:TolB-like protein
VFSNQTGWRYAPPAVLLTVLFTSCSRQPSAGLASDRIAVLRLENLSGDPTLGWTGRALSEIVASELSGAGKPRVISSTSLHAFDRLLGVRPISAPGISAESNQALAAGASQIAYGEYTVRNGRLEVRMTLENVGALKTTKVIGASVPAGDVLGAGAALARQISNKTVPYGTRNPAALEAYMKALESADATVMEVGLGVAIAADPDFVPPYRLLAQVRAQRQDRAGAVATLDRALARGNSIPEADRARLEL